MKKCLRALSCGRGRKKKDKERHDKDGGASSHDTPSAAAATTPRTTGLALTPLAAPPSPRFRYSPAAAAAVVEERQRLLPSSAASHSATAAAPPQQQRQQKQPHPQQQQRGRTPSVGPASSAASRVSMGLSPRPVTVAVGSLRSGSAPRDARSLLAHFPAAAAAAAPPACEPAPQPPLPQGSVPPSHAAAPSPAASAAAPSEHLSVRSASARRAACGTPDPSPSPAYVDVLDELQRRREREPHRFVNTDANAIVTVGCKGHHAAAPPPPPPPPSLPKQPSFVPQQNRPEAAAAAAAAVPPPAMAEILEQIQRFDTSQLQPVEAARVGHQHQQHHHHHRPAAPVAASPASPSLSAESPTYGTAPQSAARSRSHSVSLSQSPLGCPSTSLPATSGVAAASTGKEARRALAPVNPNSLGSHAPAAVPHGLRWTRTTPVPPALAAEAPPMPQQTPPSFHTGDAAASAAAAPALLSEAWNGGPQVWREAAALDLSRRSSQGDLTLQLPAQQPAQPQHYQYPHHGQGQAGARSSPLALDDDDEDDERTAEYGTSSSCSAPPFVVGTSVAPAAATRVNKQASEFEHGHGAPAPSEHEIVAMTLDHGDEYKGTARNGVPHGKGSLRYTNGNSYDGGLRDGLKWGRGMFRWRNGDCYTGEFEGDVFHGHGTFTFAGTTSAYVGLFRDGLFLGDDASAGAASSASFAAAAAAPSAAAPAPQEASASSVRAPAQAPSPAQHYQQQQQQQQQGRAADSGSPLSERGVYEDRAVVQLNLSAPDAEGLAPYWPALPWGSGTAQQHEVIDTQYRSASVSAKGTKAIFATLHQQRHSEGVLA